MSGSKQLPAEWPANRSEEAGASSPGVRLITEASLNIGENTLRIRPLEHCRTTTLPEPTRTKQERLEFGMAVFHKRVNQNIRLESSRIINCPLSEDYDFPSAVGSILA